MNKYLMWCLLGIFLFTTARYIRGGCDFSFFIVAGDAKIDQEQHPFDIKILTNSQGYDGLYFYQLALQPTSNDPNAWGISSVFPYRKQRILYPAVAYIMALGNQEYVPLTLVFANLLAVVGLFFMIQKILKHFNADSRYILLFFCFSGIFISLSRDLCEVFEALFIVLSLFAFLKNRVLLFSIAATGALLTKEVSLLIIGPGILLFLIKEMSQQRYKARRLLTIFIPLLVFGTWQLYLQHQFGGWVSKSTQFNPIPLIGIYDGISYIFSDGYPSAHQSETYTTLYGLYVIGYLTFFLWTIYLARPKKIFPSNLFEIWLLSVWVIWFVFMLFLERQMYDSDLGFGRVLNGFSIICFVILISRKTKIPKLYILYAGMTALAVMLRTIVFA